jgi:glycosyltransferase involved in cell wall biosynthesis
MRVLLVSHLFPPDGIAGVERYTQRLAGELVRQGDTVSVVARSHTSAQSTPRIVRDRMPDGTLVHRIAGSVMRQDRFLADHERYDQLFGAILAETRPDVVHVNHLIGLSAQFLTIAHRYGAAVVLTLHDYYFACPRFQLRQTSGELCQGPEGGQACTRTCFANESAAAQRRWEVRATYFRQLLATADRVIAPSRHLAAFFERFAGSLPQLHVLPNGVLVAPTEAWQPPQTTPQRRGALRLAFLGMVAPHKGVHVIVEALRHAAIDDVELLILGQIHDPKYARGLHEQAAAIPGLRMHMLGAYQPTELCQLLRDIDCVLVPSQWPENFPLVTQEALARGIPLIASRLGGLTEIVTEEINGLLFDHRQPQELATILRRLASDEQFLLQLRAGAAATPVMTMPAHVAALRALYRMAVEDRRHADWAQQSATEELSRLFAALLDLGFGGADRQAAIGATSTWPTTAGPVPAGAIVE